MAVTTHTSSPPSAQDHIAAGGVMVSHGLQHFYGHAFHIILAAMYSSLGLTPIAAGLIGTARQVSAGVATMGGGFLMDKFQHRRLLILYGSLVMMGVGYLLVSMAPTYSLILVAIAIAGAAGSIWHPAALGLLSQSYPHRRGLVMSLHRSTGNVGDTVGPLVTGALLVVLTWQEILVGAFPLALGLMLLLWIVLRKARLWQQLGATRRSGASRPIGEQVRSLKELFTRGGGLIVILLVAGISGMGQGGLMLWLPIYLGETQGMGTLGQGFHVALLTGVGIVFGPITGLLSDRVGRLPVIILVLGAKAFIGVLIAIVGGGVLFTLLVAAMGAFLFGGQALIQAWALDLAEGRNLEGTMVGLLWGNNAVFRGTAPLIVSFAISALGFGVLFWYIAVMNALAVFLIAILVPTLRGRGSASV